MSEPDVEAVIEAAQKRRGRPPKTVADAVPPVETPDVPVPVQPVTLQPKPEPVVDDDDPRIANLVRVGLTVVEARALVTAQRRMW